MHAPASANAGANITPNTATGVRYWFFKCK